eukprot:1459260-Amphidinium_carterae.1
MFVVSQSPKPLCRRSPQTGLDKLNKTSDRKDVLGLCCHTRLSTFHMWNSISLFCMKSKPCSEAIDLDLGFGVALRLTAVLVHESMQTAE